MEAPVKQTWKPLTAGILNIIDGIFSIFGALGMFIFCALISMGSQWADLNEVNLGMNPDSLVTLFLVMGIITLVLAILEIVGGIFAIKRKLWGLALAGSIASALPFSVLGILSIIFLAMGKDEFV
jgi:hypothetical protein